MANNIIINVNININYTNIPYCRNIISFTTATTTSTSCNNHQTVEQCEPGRHVNASWSERAVSSLLKHLRQTSPSSSVALDHVFTDYFRFPGKHTSSISLLNLLYTKRERERERERR
jgi:hypothetical protein